MEVRASCKYSSVHSVMLRAAEVSTRRIGLLVSGMLTEAYRGAKSSGAAMLLHRQLSLIRAR